MLAETLLWIESGVSITNSRCVSFIHDLTPHRRGILTTKKRFSVLWAQDAPMVLHLALLPAQRECIKMGLALTP